MNPARASTPRFRGPAEPWGSRAVAALLRALDSLDDDLTGQCTVEVRDRRIGVRPVPVAGVTRHANLLACGQVAGAAELALRASGWSTRTEVVAGPLVQIVPTGRRSPTAQDLARHRVDRSGVEVVATRPDRARLVAIVRAARLRNVAVELMNGPTREGMPAWHSLGTVPAETYRLDLAWARDPVFAVRTEQDEARDAVVAGRAAHRVAVAAALWAVRATLYTAPFDDERARRPGDDPGPTIHALVHLHG